MAKKPKSAIWVIIHCEIFEAGFYDEMIFHLASSQRNADRYLAEHQMVAHSWWRIERHPLDCDDYPEPAIAYYSNKGKSLKSAPHERAWAAYERWTTRSAKWKAKNPWPPFDR
jgi:hypothetical protein